MIYVKVRKGQSIDKALSILKKKVKESKLMVELREREFYTKPSVIKKEKKAKAILRNKKDLEVEEINLILELLMKIQYMLEI